MQTFSSSTRIEAPPETVWAIMTDHARYAEWTPVSEVTLEVEGSPDRNGVGAIRVFHSGPIKNREEVTAFDPPRCMTYRLLSGPMPVRNYRSEMLLVEDDQANGCELHWDSWFEPVIPFTGGLLRRFMAASVAKMAAGIATEARDQAQMA